MSASFQDDAKLVFLLVASIKFHGCLQLITIYDFFPKLLSADVRLRGLQASV